MPVFQALCGSLLGNSKVNVTEAWLGQVLVCYFLSPAFTIDLSKGFQTTSIPSLCPSYFVFWRFNKALCGIQSRVSSYHSSVRRKLQALAFFPAAIRWGVLPGRRDCSASLVWPFSLQTPASDAGSLRTLQIYSLPCLQFKVGGDEIAGRWRLSMRSEMFLTPTLFLTGFLIPYLGPEKFHHP